MTQPDLSIIIVNWNTGALLARCLRTIARETSALTYEVIVVDNASTDDSVARLRRDFPEVNLIVSETNRGYAGGNNLALPAARGRAIVLLNPDTEITDRALERLLALLDERPQAGAVGASIIEPSGRYAVQNCGWQPTIGTVFAHYSGLSRLWPTRIHGLNLLVPRRQRVGWLSGACLMVRQRVAGQIGALHEGWFMYAEDMEWCDRISARGWELWYEPAARVLHLDRQSTGQRQAELSTTWAHALRGHYRRRCRPGRLQLACFDLILCGGLLSRACLYAARSLTGRNRSRWRREARSFLRAALEIARSRGREPAGRAAD